MLQSAKLFDVIEIMQHDNDKEHDRITELQINDVKLAEQLNSTQLLIEKLVDRVDNISKDTITVANEYIKIKSYFIGGIFILTPLMAGYTWFVQDKMKLYDMDNQNHYSAISECKQASQLLDIRLTKLETILNDKSKVY